MKIKKEIVQSVILDNGDELKYGDTIIFNTKNSVHYGTFIGITPKGALSFEAVINNTMISYAVMPSSIENVERA